MQAARGLKGDLHEFLITPRGTALYTSYVVTEHDLSSVGGPKHGTIQDAIFQEQDLATGKVLHDGTASTTSRSMTPTGPWKPNWDFFHINSVDLDGDGDLMISARNTTRCTSSTAGPAGSSGAWAASAATSPAARRELLLAARRAPARAAS